MVGEVVRGFQRFPVSLVWLVMARLSVYGFIEVPKTGVRMYRAFHERDFFESRELRRARFERVLQMPEFAFIWWQRLCILVSWKMTATSVSSLEFNNLISLVLRYWW